MNAIEKLRARIAADTAKLAELEAAQKAADAMQNLSQGDTVQFMYGRGETRKQYTGEVRAVFETDKGKRVKILAGEGADEEIYVIEPSAIVGVGTEQGADAHVETMQATQATAALDPLAAAADPLAAIN
jgi:hypothetical protein